MYTMREFVLNKLIKCINKYKTQNMNIDSLTNKIKQNCIYMFLNED